MEPENAEIYHGLGATCIDAERYSDSIPYYEKAISLDGKAQYYEALAVALAYCQETERAKEVLKTVSAKGSTRVSEIRYFIERIEAGNISEEDDE